jgi:predicted phosphodiesterase
MLIGYVIFEYIQINRTSKLFLGNQPDKLLKMEKDASREPYTFYVIGDTVGRSDILEEFISRSKERKPAFLVHVGDFVRYPSLDEHRFFIAEIAETGFNRPIFLVPGNHDIPPDWPSSKELFENLYGPTNFYFRFRDSLFIFLSSQKNKSFLNSLKFLEEILRSDSSQAHYRFIFLHYLPGFYPDMSIKDNKEAERLLEERLLDLLKRYKVNYVFTGHLHTYYREKVGDCIFITPGSGGSTIRRQEIDPNYHSLEITVNPEQIKERLHSIEKHSISASLPVEDQMEYYLWTKLVPQIKEKMKNILP